MLFSPDPVVGGVPVVFTIHNLAFQGIFPARDRRDRPRLGRARRAGDGVLGPDQLPEGRASTSASGSRPSARPTRREIIERRSSGLDSTASSRRRADDLVGILNGIDTTRWNPATDAFVPARFTRGRPRAARRRRSGRCSKRSACRRDDRGRCGAGSIGLVSRLTDQKGFDLIAAAADELMSLDATWVMLGSGERRYEDLWRRLAARFPERVSRDDRLRRAAGAPHRGGRGHVPDAVPLRALRANQLYSLRYGTLPIVRATGGLKDTVGRCRRAGRAPGSRSLDYTPGGAGLGRARALDGVTGAATLARDPAARHGAGPFLGRFGP